MIGIDRSAGSDLIRLVAVYPSMIGSWVSIRMRSGRWRLLTVLDFDDLIVCGGKHIADNLSIIRLVLDHQNALAHAGST